MDRKRAATLALRIALGAVLVNHALWMATHVPRWERVLAGLALPPGLVLPLAALELASGALVLSGRAPRAAAALVAPWLLWWGAAARPLGAPVGWMMPVLELAAFASLLVLSDARLARFAPFALWPVRVAAGAIMVDHGLDKLLRFEAWTADFAEIGFPAPALLVALVGFAECAGGVGIVLGVLARFSSAVLSGVLAVAIVAAWLPRPPGAGWDFDVLLIGAFAAILLAGPGRPTPGSVLGRAWGDPEERLWRALRRGTG